MDHDVRAARAAALRIGPGARLERVAALLAALDQAAASAAAIDASATRGAAAVARFHDVAELLLFGPSDRVLLDADHVRSEDVGFVRRFLALRPSAAIEVFGTDRNAPVARALLAFDGSRWRAWPMDLAELEKLLEPPAGAAKGPRGGRAAVATPPEPILEVVPAPVAAASSRPGRVGKPAPGNADDEGGAFDWRAPLGDLGVQLRRTAEAHLNLRGTTGGDGPGGAASEALGLELVRLERCVRAMALGADRGPRQLEDLDFDALVEEELAVLALQSRRAPRVRFSGGEVLPVRAERDVLVHALGVLLELVRSLAGANEQVEVRSSRLSAERGPDGARAVVRLRSPAGPLAGLAPSALFHPSGLGERVPGFAPNELFVLAKLCEARGMGLEARQTPGASPAIEFELSLPLAERPSQVASTAGPTF